MKAQADVHEKAGKNQQTPANTHAQQGAQDEGGSWQLYLVMAVIVIGVLGLVGKALGLF